MSNNVSFQLFNKQLQQARESMFYGGCNNDMQSPYLHTCVDEKKSGLQVEQAFQNQLFLNEYYKGQSVFNGVKRKYMDNTLEKIKYSE